MKSLLVYFIKLKTLHLELRLNNQPVDPPDDVAMNGFTNDSAILLQSLDFLRFEIKAEFDPNLEEDDEDRGWPGCNILKPQRTRDLVFDKAHLVTLEFTFLSSTFSLRRGL